MTVGNSSNGVVLLFEQARKKHNASGTSKIVSDSHERVVENDALALFPDEHRVGYKRGEITSWRIRGTICIRVQREQRLRFN